MRAPELVIVDSSVWIEAFRVGGEPRWRLAVDGLLAADRAATCEVVMLEILRGAASAGQFEALLARMRGMHRLTLDGTSERAGLAALKLRARGQTVPPTDLLIAAAAQLHGAALLHRDKHLSLAAEALGVPEYKVG
jgi:predicted nucleic acid-binding protein